MARETVSFPTKNDDFPVHYVTVNQGTLNIIKHRPNHQLLQNAPSGSQVSGRTAATASAAADKARLGDRLPRLTGVGLSGVSGVLCVKKPIGPIGFISGWWFGT